jgi:hypothetical protein
MAAGYDAPVIVAVGQQEQVSQSCQQRNFNVNQAPRGRCQYFAPTGLGTLTETEQRQKRHCLCQIKGFVTQSARTNDRFLNSPGQILRNSNLLSPSLLLAYVLQKVASPMG